MLDADENLKELFLETGHFDRWLDDPRVGVKMRKRLTAQIKAEIRKEAKEGIREEVKAEVKEEVKAEVKEEVKAEVKEEVKAEVKEEVKAEVKEEVKAEVKEEVKAEVRAESITQAKREMTLSCIRLRFGAVPLNLLERVEQLNAEGCQRLFDLAMTAISLDVLLESE